MKKITLLLFFLISLGQTYAQQGCTSGNCQNIPVLENNTAWSTSHGSPSWYQSSVWMWSYNNRGEGVNYSGYNFIKDQRYCVSFTLSATSNSNQNGNSTMNVILTQNPVTGTITSSDGAAIPSSPTPNQEIMNSHIWSSIPNTNTYQFTFIANENFNNLWFFPRKAESTVQVEARIINLNICDITCDYGEDWSFFFRDKKGNTKDTFNLCENVTINAIANTQAFPLSIELYKVNTDNTVTLLSTREDSDKLFDLTDFFVNTPTNPVIFEENTTYEVKAALDRGGCGIVYGIERFTYTSGNLSSAFKLNYDCKDGAFDATTVSLNQDVQQSWRLYETGVAGSTSDTDIIKLVKEYTGNTEYTFKDLDPKKFYYIAHTISATINCSVDETRIALTPNCCISDPEIFAYCEDPCVLDSFPLKVKDIDGNIITSLDGSTFKWTNINTGETSTNDIVIATTSDQWSLALTLPEYNCVYELDFSVSCCKDTIQLQTHKCPTSRDIEELTTLLNDIKFLKTNTGYKKHISHTNSLKKVLKTTTRKGAKTTAGCQPCNDGLFIIRVVDNLGNLVTDFNSITWNDGLYPNQNIRWGTVDTEYKATIITNSSNGSTTCSYEDTIIYECESTNACENVGAPTNLKVTNTTLSWSPVPGAVSYIIKASQQDNALCCSNSGSLFTPINTNSNSYKLPVNLEKKCFSWEVVAICGDNSNSAPSLPFCYTPKIEEPSTCNLPAPTNLSNFGNRLTWSKVPGAKGYIVRSPLHFSPCCLRPQILLLEMTTKTNYIELKNFQVDKCFTWEVVAVCSNDKTSSLSSNPSCFSRKGFIEDGFERSQDLKEDISIFPNPNKGQMNIKINSDTSLDIFRLDGSLVKSIKKMNTIDSVFNLQSNLPKGIYIFKFNTKNGIISKQVIIK